MTPNLETQIDEFIAAEAKRILLTSKYEHDFMDLINGANLLKPALLKVMKALEFYGIGDYKFGPEPIHLNLVKLMDDDGKLSRTTIQEIKEMIKGK